MSTNAIRVSGVFMIAIAIMVAMQFVTAADEKKGGYGKPSAKPKQVEGDKPAKDLKIDTSKKPMPADDTVVVIFAHSGDDFNWADGGFSLSKAGGGRTIHMDGNRTLHVDAPLVGYGTTETGNTWIYEIQGLKVEGRKVFVGIYAKYSDDEAAPVWISTGKDAPTEFYQSFKPAGVAAAGKKMP